MIAGARGWKWCNYHSVRQDSLCHFPRHLAFQGLEGGKNREGSISLRGPRGGRDVCEARHRSDGEPPTVTESSQPHKLISSSLAIPVTQPRALSDCDAYEARGGRVLEGAP